MPTPTAKPPGNTAHLQRLAKDGAERAGVPQGRYQRWLNTVLLSAVLASSRDDDGDPLFALKGGAAMELRLGVTARASKDYDVAFRDRSETMLDRLDEALADGWMDFAFERTEAVPISRTGDRSRSRPAAGPSATSGAGLHRLRLGSVPDRTEDSCMHRGL